MQANKNIHTLTASPNSFDSSFARLSKYDINYIRMMAFR